MEKIKKILVVEDEGLTRRAIVKALREGEAPPVVSELGDGQGVMACLREESFDCVLLDYQLPGLDGLEVLRQIRGAGIKTPVVVLTAKGDEQLAVEMMKAGASDYISKSRMMAEQLRQVVRQAVRVYRAELRTAEAQEQLRANERRLEALIKASPLGVVALDPQGIVITWNPASERMFGYSEAEALGRPLLIVPEDKWEEHRQLRERALSGQGFTGVEVPRRRKDGAMMDISIFAAPVRDDEGRTIGIIALMQDITEAKRMKQQLLAAHRMETVGRLTGGIAHDFNNLLAVIGGYGESLLRRLPADHPLRPQAEEIDKAAQRGAALTRQLLAFSRSQVMEHQTLDLNEVIENVYQMLHRVMCGSIEIDLDPQPGRALIRGDAGQMEQVLVNLAINARDAMPEGGHLVVSTRTVTLADAAAAEPGLSPGRYVILSIQDTGCGMDEEVRTRIFEPFFTTKKGKGTGLGLSIVYGIVQQCGGDIRVQSVVGKGTRFDVLLPAVEPSSAGPKGSG
jgi:PAS domain S-box-containing protein